MTSATVRNGSSSSASVVVGLLTSPLLSRVLLLAGEGIASWGVSRSTRPSGTPGTATTEGTIRMDLRFVAFDLIARHAGLRALLVNYADRIEHGHAPDGPATGGCFLALQWIGDDPTCAPAEPQLLTAQAHMPRHCSTDPLFLDFVLERLTAALTVGAARELIAIRRLATSRGFAESDVGTIYKASAFEIAPAPRQRTREAVLDLERLEPWTGGVHPGACGVVRSSSAFMSMN